MFVGHMAVALAAKARLRDVNAGWLMAAALLPDLLWPWFVLAGVERVRIEPGATAFTPLVFEWYPWSHSLAAAVVWGGTLGWFAVRRAWPWMLALTVSHWVLDVATHVADMPWWPGSGLVGLGLWRSVGWSLAAEGVLWGAAVVWYWRGFRPRAGVFWSLVGLVTVMWAASPFGAPPPSVMALAGVGLAAWLIPFWMALADRRRG